METKALEKSWENLPPLSRMLLKAMLFTGTLAIAYKMGFFSWAGFVTISSILAVFAMIFFSIASTEQSTREAFYGHYEKVKAWFIASLAETMKEESQGKKAG